MIFMLVCEKERIQFFYSLPYNLLAEIGPRINDEAFAIYYDMYGGTEAFVPKIN
jgi:hypothetical protein